MCRVFFTTSKKEKRETKTFRMVKFWNQKGSKVEGVSKTGETGKEDWRNSRNLSLIN